MKWSVPWNPDHVPHLDDLFAVDAELRNPAFEWAMGATENPVDWAYTVWDRAVQGLAAKNNHVRSVCAQLLCNLAKSDPDKRMLRDFQALLQVTRDDRFVTARHCLQNIWKVGAAGNDQMFALLIAGLRARYVEAANEKNGTLVRFDISVGLAKLYEATGQESVRHTALAWIEEEPDLKYRRKYAQVWSMVHRRAVGDVANRAGPPTLPGNQAVGSGGSGIGLGNG